eukprot:15481106-Alexandrium_andersonii.AAC.1
MLRTSQTLQTAARGVHPLPLALWSPLASSPLCLTLAEQSFGAKAACTRAEQDITLHALHNLM